MSLWDKFFNRARYRETEPRASSRFLYRFSAGIPITEETAMKTSALYRGLIYISSSVAKLPYEILDSEKNPTNDALSKLVSLSPNSEINSMTFRLLGTQKAILDGNFYAEIERNMLGQPIALWPLMGNCYPERNRDNGKLQYRVLNGGLDGYDAILDPRDVFHIRNLHTKDGLTGLSLIEYATDILGITLGTNRFAESLFKNSGMPSGVFTSEGSLSEEARARIKQSWQENQGGENTLSPAVLEGGLRFQPIDWQPDQLQALESRKFNVSEIARFVGVPPSKLYDTEAQTYNNIEHANLEVVMDTIDPWTRIWEYETDVKLLNNRRGGKQASIDMFQMFRGDLKTVSDYYKTMFGIGSLNPNEIRKTEGRAPYDGGDNYYIANNNFVPVNRLDEVIDSQLKSKDNSNSELEEVVKNYVKSRYN